AGVYSACFDLGRVPDKSRPDLCAGRSGRTARRPQRRVLLRSARRDDKVHRHAFRHHYAQSDYDGAHESSVRCHDGRAWRVSAGVRGSGSRGSFPRGELAKDPRTLPRGNRRPRVIASNNLLEILGKAVPLTRTSLPRNQLPGDGVTPVILAGRLPPYPPNSRLAKRPRVQARGLFLSVPMSSTERPAPGAVSDTARLGLD